LDLENSQILEQRGKFYELGVIRKFTDSGAERKIL
jgi:hypothetical protein